MTVNSGITSKGNDAVNGTRPLTPSHLCEASSVAFWNILMVLSIAAGCDLGAGSWVCFTFIILSLLLLVTSTFMAPRRSRRLSFPLLAALVCTCAGFSASICSCEELPSSVFNTTGSPLCSANLLPSSAFCVSKVGLSVGIAFWCASVFSSWLVGTTSGFFSQCLTELVLMALTPPPLVTLWEQQKTVG